MTPKQQRLVSKSTCLENENICWINYGFPLLLVGYLSWWECCSRILCSLDSKTPSIATLSLSVFSLVRGEIVLDYKKEPIKVGFWEVRI